MMQDLWGGMGWEMGLGGLLGLVLVVIIAFAAFVKYRR